DRDEGIGQLGVDPATHKGVGDGSEVAGEGLHGGDDVTDVDTAEEVADVRVPNGLDDCTVAADCPVDGLDHVGEVDATGFGGGVGDVVAGDRVADRVVEAGGPEGAAHRPPVRGTRPAHRPHHVGEVGDAGAGDAQGESAHVGQAGLVQGAAEGGDGDAAAE